MYEKIVVSLLSICLGFSRCDLDLLEGSTCTWDGVNGTCISLYKCRSVALTTVYSRSGYGNGPDLPEVCSNTDAGDPIYCCTDCMLDYTQSLSNSVVLPEAKVVERKPSLSWNKCAKYFQQLPFRCRGKVRYSYTSYRRYLNEERQCHDVVANTAAFGVGGRDATRWEFPHMALLGFGETQASAQWLCGGSVISERFILRFTAAHCSSTPSLVPITFAALGILKRSDLEEFWKVYRITRIIVHPEYRSPSKYHDIALLETDREINFGRDLLPACLDTPIADTYSHYVEAPGWGRLGNNKPLADTLQVLELRSFNETVCKAIFPELRLLKNGYNHTTQMCYGAREYNFMTDTCEGDSGGPLKSSDDCLCTIIGVTSFGKDCGAIGSAGVYTRVKYYVDWIERQVWPELYTSFYNKTIV